MTLREEMERLPLAEAVRTYDAACAAGRKGDIGEAEANLIFVARRIAAGEWTKTPPSKQGRYWWRAPDPYDRPECRQYGMILITWQSFPERDLPPKLYVRSMCTFNAAYGGELQDHGGWSYGGGQNPKDLLKSYPGIEFWSEPVAGPPDLLPALPGKPEWTPRDPKKVEAERAKHHKEAARRQAAELSERATLIASAKKNGETLYVCTSCDELINEGDLVQIRECTHCGDEAFDGTENGQACPNCNRTFSRKVTDKGCIDCLAECEVFVDESETEPAPPLPEPKKKRRRHDGVPRVDRRQ